MSGKRKSEDGDSATVVAASAGVFDDADEDNDTNKGDTSETAPAAAAEEPASKRQRTEETPAPIEQAKGESNDKAEEDDLFAASPVKASSASSSRVAGLSKFVRRILDPNRKPMGLVEAPSIIPLNDEFLQAFGRREKDYDEQVGKSPEEIDRAIVDDEDKDADAKLAAATATTEDESYEPAVQRKVKFTNLRYTTSARLLEEECLNFGPVEEINMIMDDTDPDGIKNIGRAYVLFAKTADAQNCVDQQCGGAVDGRSVRLTLAEPFRKGGGPGGGTGGPGGGKPRVEKRYYQKDMSTKCYRCGQVGHIAAECPNPAKAAVCPLCAISGQHDMRSCPLNRVCFNCGVPGHINRECPQPRGSQPPRSVCSICCGSGHTRFQCSSSMSGVAAEAVCCVCFQKGHFMCSPLKWFFGLEGVFCYNCGGKGHVGNQCQRPSLDDLGRNDGWAVKEVERAEEYKLADEMEVERTERHKKEREREQEKSNRRDRFRDNDRNRHNQRHQNSNNSNNRAKSAPPNRGRDNNDGGGEFYDDFTAGYNHDNSSNSNNNNRNSGNNTTQPEFRFTVGDNDNTSNSNNQSNNNSRNGRGHNNASQNQRRQSGGSGGNRGRRRGY